MADSSGDRRQDRPSRPGGTGGGRPARPGGSDDRRTGRPGAGDDRRTARPAADRTPQSGKPPRSGASGGPRGPRKAAPDRAELEKRVYDPRREARRQLARVALPDDVDPRELEPESRKQLSSLTKETADLVARHLVMAGRLMDEEPDKALAHARAARALGGRVAVVREVNGLVAYAAGEWGEALTELRTHRRISGDPDHLPVMADCERALGRPDRALAVADDPQAGRLAPASRVELLIVASGARRDLGQPEAAAVSLEIGALEGPVRDWTARLRYAYADALLECGREDDARTWFARAAEVDELGQTDAEERLLELDGIVFTDLEEDEEGLVEMSTSEASPQVSAGADEGDEGLTLF